MDGLLKTSVGWLVGKLVFTAQLIPITTPDLLRKCSARFFYSKALREKWANAWVHFERYNQSLALDKKLDLNRYFVDVPAQRLADPTKPDDNTLHNITAAKLDTIELCHPQHQDSEKYIIYVWGRSDCYEKRLNRLANDALNLNAHIISFNLRGVGHSTNFPRSQLEVAADLLAQVDALVEQRHIKPEHISLHGHSLGGGVEIITKGMLKNREKNKAVGPTNFEQESPHAVSTQPRFKIRNDRSFRSLLDVSCNVNFVHRRTRQAVTRFFTVLLSFFILANLAALNILSLTVAAGIFAGITLSTRWHFTYKIWDSFLPDILRNCQLGLMRYSNWAMDVAKLWDSFDDNEKSYMVISQPKHKYSQYGLGKKNKTSDKKDKIIWPPFTLHRGLVKRKDRLNYLKDLFSKTLHQFRESTIERDEPAVYDTYQQKLIEIQDQMIQLKNVNVTGGGHGDDPKHFVTRFKDPSAKRYLTGQEQWFAFVEPEGGHLNPEPRHYKSYGFSI